MTFARARIVVVSLSLASIGSGLFSATPTSAATTSEHRFGTPTLTLPRERGREPLSAPGAASPNTASPPCDSQFHQVAGANPGTAGNIVLNNSLAAISATDIWAVGARADLTTGPTGTAIIGPDAPLVEHWDGSSWTSILVDNPSMMGSAALEGVAIVPGATTAINNVFAVGHAWYYGAHHPLAEQRSATSSTGWNVITPANIGNGDNILNSVAAITATNVWAVGSWREDNGDSTATPPRSPTPRRTLIAHWDGTTMTSMAGPNASSTSSDRLFGVSASGPNDVWAVGITIDAGARRELILHYDGTGWSIAPSANLIAGKTLYSVKALSPKLVYAVGDYVDVNTGRSHPLVEQWDGYTWFVVPDYDLTAPGSDNYFFSVSALSANDVWVGGGVFSPNSGQTPSAGLAEHYNGMEWKIVPSVQGTPGGFNEFNAILPVSPGHVWVAGDYVNSAQTQELTLFEHLCIAAPTVTGVLPMIGNVTPNYGATRVAIRGTQFSLASGVKFGSTDSPWWHVDSDNLITAYAPDAVAGAVDVTVTSGGGTSATSLADLYVYVPPAISWRQYALSGSDGQSWQGIDGSALAIRFTPAVDSNAILSANADLWTSVAGVNQDIGIWVAGAQYATGQLVAWKESGGFAGTFSPNAAYLQTIIPVTAGQVYTAGLVWKANKRTSGTIYMAAGNGPSYSPTRITAELVPIGSPNLKSVTTNSQYWIPNGGATGGPIDAWQPIDVPNLNVTFTPSANSSAVLSGNADLWTSVAGVNQDLGILVAGGTYGSGTIVGWKESGGFAGTYSPNAAFVQTVIPVVGGTQYTVYLAWKANKATSGNIFAAAGSAGNYSPTRLTVHLLPASAVTDASANQQYYKVGSTGADWTPIDSTNLKLTVIPAANSLYVLSANADLWTATAGVNQDMGIFISGGAYGSGVLVAWKESGGFAGTFSPNAASVQTVLPLAIGITYTITLEWKANKSTDGVIYAGAGGPGNYSPTRITAQLAS